MHRTDLIVFPLTLQAIRLSDSTVKIKIMQTWSRPAMQRAILKEITWGFFRTLPNTVLKEVAGV